MAAIVKGNRGDYYRDGIIHDRLPNRQGRLLAFAFCNLLPQRNFRRRGGGGLGEGGGKGPVIKFEMTPFYQKQASIFLLGNRGDCRDGIIHDRLPNRQGRLLAFAFCCCKLLPQRNFRSGGWRGRGLERKRTRHQVRNDSILPEASEYFSSSLQEWDHFNNSAPYSGMFKVLRYTD
ncbi:hypothetical protein CDAR_309911 [Caerostris darwini]|uniref:Uncharacterized protein n=1 Tax=Caerostris darwini TaxID=1538125 RepID=A0AAV4VXT6_9ARAC|nr:hypothetical protein CDAR_309911 [Caerostris darwini]